MILKYLRRLSLILAFAVLISVSFSLRFINLGYSEYNNDEKKAMLNRVVNRELGEFLLDQRKGPMQFFVSYIPYLFTHDFRNEFAERLPFALLNFLSVPVLFFLILRLAKSHLAAFFVSFLYSANGFIVGFSRIAQYQSLNLFFSLLSLLFFTFLLDSKKRLLLFSMLGTLFFCLSLLSHWDAVYYAVPVLYVFFRFLCRKDLTLGSKVRVAVLSLVLGCALVLPFLIPYAKGQLSNNENIQYFERRVGLGGSPFDRHKYIFELYNPFFVLPFYLVFAAVALIKIKKNAVYILWFTITFLIIKFGMKNPGTHIYNYVLPLLALSGVGLWDAYSFLPRHIKPLVFLVFSMFVSFFYYQSYFLFVDHTREYPYETKKILKWEVSPHESKNVLTFGFPHFRDWKNTNVYLLSRNENCSYITNEGKEISQIYMKFPYGITDRPCYYIIVIKRPFITTQNGVTFAKTSNLERIYTYKRGSESLVKVYLVTKK